MLNLVIIGDSIAKGYGSSKSLEGGFGTVLGEKLSADVTNLGIVGLDSEQLLNKLSQDKFVDAVEDADVICLSIGSNDLLKPFLSIFADSLGVEGEQKELFAKIQNEMYSSAKKNPLKTADMLSTAMKRLTDNDELNSACEQFPDRFNSIISRIKQINPDVIIYADNIYNPYYGVAYEYEGISVFNVQQLCEPYIKKLNTTFQSNENYTVIDMYSVFRRTGYTNVDAKSLADMKGINLDPHPNDEGYRVMADYIYTHLDSIVPVVKNAEFEPAGNGGYIKISFSENVRLVEKKQLIIQSEDKQDVFVYDIEQEQYVNGQDSVLELDVAAFKPSDNNKNSTFKPGLTYTLIPGDGAIKDKGNNHLEGEMIKFTLPAEKEETAVRQTSSLSVINNCIKSGYGSVGIIVVIIILMAVFFAVLKVRINKKKIKEDKKDE